LIFPKILKDNNFSLMKRAALDLKSEKNVDGDI
jgi:hypothetical protein